MSELPLADYRWLIGSEADQWLQRIDQQREKTLNSLTKMLRRELSASRTHQLIEQSELRQRALRKFPDAGRMFFTSKSLEQATEEIIADYKALRFGAASAIDLCCGIGGDALSLAKHNPVDAVERDNRVALFAQENSDRLNRQLRIQCRDACQDDIKDILVHIDPDRRPGNRRQVEIAACQPGQEFIDHLITKAPGAAVKVAPACSTPEQWRGRVEREWLATRGECRQQVLWSGCLVRQTAEHRATRLASTNDGAVRVVYSFSGAPHVALTSTNAVDRYIFEPAPEILAADLTGSLAEDLQLTQPFTSIPYLTSPRPNQHAALQAFEVLEQLPFDRRRVRQALQALGLGRIEVKKRGTRLDPAEIQRFLRNDGPDEGTVILAGVAQRVTAVIARRLQIP